MGSRINGQNKRPASCLCSSLAWLGCYPGDLEEALAPNPCSYSQSQLVEGVVLGLSCPSGAPRQWFYCSLWDLPHKSGRLLWSYYPPGLNQSISFSIPYPESAGWSLHSHPRVEKMHDTSPWCHFSGACSEAGRRRFPRRSSRCCSGPGLGTPRVPGPLGKQSRAAPSQGFHRKRLPTTQQHLGLQLLNHKLEAHGQRQGPTSLPN